MEKYNPMTDQWTKISHLNQIKDVSLGTCSSVRPYYSVAAFGGKLYILRTIDNYTSSFSNNRVQCQVLFTVFDPTDGTWEVLPSPNMNGKKKP